MFAGAANAAVVATVPLGSSANYSVLGGSTVTNTGNSTLAGSLGVWPGTSITGFPPGKVLAPATTDKTNAAAKNAQSNLTAAYVNAARRPLDATTAADLSGRVLQGGVYAGPTGQRSGDHQLRETPSSRARMTAPAEVAEGRGPQ